MYRCLKVDFFCDKNNLDKLFACNRISAQIWNHCLDLANNYRTENEGAWISKANLFSGLKKRYPLHSQSVQSVAESYCEARDATKAARDIGLNTRYPWRLKGNYPTTWKSPKGFTIDYSTRTLTLKLGIYPMQQGPIKVKLSQATLDRIGSTQIKEVSLIWDNRLMLTLCLDDRQEKPEPICSDTEAGIDLGIIHSITAFADNGQATIITGRLLRSINRYRNKKLAEFQKLMNRCTKYSRRWKRLKCAKRRLLSKLDAQVRDITHKITRSFVRWAEANNVSKVFVGNVEGVQRNTRNGSKKKRRTKQVSQELSNWNFGQQLNYLKYKLEAVGIRLSKISEAYSTQTCPVCGRRKKAKGRNYVCKCGYTAHRDIHGARNILSLGQYRNIRWIAEIQNITYLRTA